MRDVLIPAIHLLVIIAKWIVSLSSVSRIFVTCSGTAIKDTAMKSVHTWR
jgi:hypothetical protein